VVFGNAPMPGHDFPREVKNSNGIKYTYFSSYGEALREIEAKANSLQLTEADAPAGVLIHRAGTALEADLVFTGRPWLLAGRGPSSWPMPSPAEALVLIGLYLGWDELPAVLGGTAIRWH
jgi:hypothetical protein